jgi:hypothetical protein
MSAVTTSAPSPGDWPRHGVVDRAIIAKISNNGCDDRGMSTLFTHVPHPHIEERRTQSPVKVADQLRTTGRAAKANTWLAIKITNGVGTMWCAYAFAILALISLPDAIKLGKPAIISWIAQTFLQLVLLSIIIVGQNIQSTASDKRAEATYNDADAVLHEALQIQKHLEAQDQAIEHILDRISPPSTPGGATA